MTPVGFDYLGRIPATDIMRNDFGDSSENIQSHRKSKESKSVLTPINIQVREQVSDSDVYVNILSDLPHSMKIYINFCYYLFLSPFRVIYDEKLCRHKIHSYKPHTIICGLLHPIYLLHSALLIRGCLKRKILELPSIIFTVANNMSRFGYISIFLYTFWFRKKQILTLFTISERTLNSKIKYSAILLCSLGACMGISASLLEDFIDEDGQRKNATSWFTDHTNNYLYVWFARNYSTSTQVQFADFTPGLYAFGVINYFLKLIFGIYINYFDMLGYVFTLSAYRSVRDSHRAIFSSENRKSNVKILLQHYYDTSDLLNKINYVGNYILLVIYIQIITWVSETAVIVLDVAGWLLTSMIVYYFCFYILILGMAAETHYKMEEFQGELLEHIYQDNSKYNSYEYVAAYIKMSAKESGIRAGQFFTASYEFLGALISSLVTYGIIMIQLLQPD